MFQVGGLVPLSGVKPKESCPETPRPQWSLTHHSLPMAMRPPGPKLVDELVPLLLELSTVAASVPEMKTLAGMK